MRVKGGLGGELELKRAARATRRLAEAEREYRSAVVDAVRSGWNYAEVARATGMRRQAVRALVLEELQSARGGAS